MTNRNSINKTASKTFESTTMSSLQLKGKGLGKGGVKRRPKIFRGHIEHHVNKPAFKRLARRAGCKRLSFLIYDELRCAMKVFMENLLRDAIAHTELSRRCTLTTTDVLCALRKQGITLFGFGA